MRILVYPHDLDLGGSQLNAIELAAAVRDLGHEVLVFGRRGTLTERIAALGLEFIESPKPGRRPSLQIAHHLRRLIRHRSIDVVHGYEWPPILEARLAVLASDASCIGTVMSMAVAPFIPRGLPLVVGTAQIGAAERANGRRSVRVIEPPIDLRYNAPGVVADVHEFADRFGVDTDRPVLVAVSRLAKELKLEGLLCAIRTVRELPNSPVLVIVGDGPEREAVSRAAHQENVAAGRTAVVLTGALNDPRPAYSIADVVLGMGGSVLRGMAFVKPVVVQGEHGFWRALTPESLAEFRWQGWYGVGTGSLNGPDRLRAELGPLLEFPAQRLSAARFAHQVVRSDYSLEAAALAQQEVYRAAVTQRAGQGLDVGGDLTGAIRLVTHMARRRGEKLRGTSSSDDFNAQPLAMGRV